MVICGFCYYGGYCCRSWSVVSVYAFLYKCAFAFQALLMWQSSQFFEMTANERKFLLKWHVLSSFWRLGIYFTLKVIYFVLLVFIYDIQLRSTEALCDMFYTTFSHRWEIMYYFMWRHMRRFCRQNGWICLTGCTVIGDKCNMASLCIFVKIIFKTMLGLLPS